ncbi:MAG: CHAT domain-containing tetratricopeptide repeat protein [Pseudomonadota bacterium]
MMRSSQLACKAALAIGLSLATIASVVPVQAQQPVSLRDSFPVGSGGGDTLCQAQSRSLDPANISPFDRSWAIVCRDSAKPVGYVFALRESAGDVSQRLTTRRSDDVDCSTSQQAASSDARSCIWREGNLPYTILRRKTGKAHYVAEGFSAYNDALRLALESVMTDRLVDGDIRVVTTSFGDSAAFARVQALTLEPDQALAEGYRRNNRGDYADAAAFFETLEQRLIGEETSLDPAEFIINRALQKSNLGEFAEADALFAEARRSPTDDPVQARLRRNFEAIHLINQRQYDAARARLAEPIAPIVDSARVLREQGEITRPISARINNETSLGDILGFVDDLKLTPEERAIIIDAQARHLVATAQRLSGQPEVAREGLLQALQEVMAVRDGRVVSIIRLRTQILTELGVIAEDGGDYATAEDYYQQAITLLQTQYPETRALSAARARLGAYLVRRGENDRARAVYREVVENSLNRRSALTGFANQLAPYFDMLVGDGNASDADVQEFFEATQILVRPGVAETQAILARELSAGDDEAARLFRQSTNLTRSVERLRIEFAALGEVEDQGSVAQRRVALASEIDRLEAAQRQVLISLSAYPQYTALATRLLGLDELSDAIKPGEGFSRISVASGKVYVFFTDGETSRAWRADLSAADMERRVDAIRETISEFDPVSRQYLTTPFDVANARSLYRDLFQPIDGPLRNLDHLIFEPDGALLRLPIDLLVTDDASVERFAARADSIDGDPFDVSDVRWLARDLAVSTAVSARAFVDARDAPASGASRQYLGMGENAAIFGETRISGTRGPTGEGTAGCAWPLAEWNKPISAAELRAVGTLVGQSQSELLTGAAFSDSAIKARGDLDDYRILHFATHGLVTAPRPECPARPALLTSFGDDDSDGLLTFREIFDLRLDADLVILSACDTAGKATVAATREAGLDTGGGGSLDGLVRAFIGAGGRSVLASHWPAPDDFDATSRLITTLFAEGQDTAIWAALSAAQKPLMDDPITSHPYYWAGFAVIGDGARSLRMDSAASPAAAD